MNTQQLLPARLALATGALAIALASTVCLSTNARADVLAHYEPQAFTRAAAALERGNPDRALQELHRQRAIVNHDRYAARKEALVCRAQFEKRNFEAAERACDTAVRRGSHQDMWSHLNNRGAVRLMLGRHDEALADFRKATRLNPESRDARRNYQLARRIARDKGLQPGAEQVSML